MLANKNVYQFQHCQNALEINDSLYISGLFDNIYVNKSFHFCQNYIFGSDFKVISDGNYIRREENLSATLVMQGELNFIIISMNYFNGRGFPLF